MAWLKIDAEVLYDLWRERERARNEAVLRRDEHMHKVSAENDRLRGEVMDLRLRVITLTKEQAATHAAVQRVRFARGILLTTERDKATGEALQALFALLPSAQRDPGDEQPERDEP